MRYPYRETSRTFSNLLHNYRAAVQALREYNAIRYGTDLQALRETSERYAHHTALVSCVLHDFTDKGKYAPWLRVSQSIERSAA